jgi:pimeloyl-ACP methyl ester carboxylesterase
MISRVSCLAEVALVAAEHGRLAVLRAAGYRRRFVATSTGKLHAVSGRGWGSLPSLLVIHGLGSTIGDFAPFLLRAPTLARRIVAVDLPGHGASAEPANPAALTAMLQGLIELLATEFPGPHLVLGNSLGGLLAVRLQRAAPRQVAGLVLCSPAGAPCDASEWARLHTTFTIHDHPGGRRFAEDLLAGPHWMAPLVALGVRRRMTAPLVRELLAVRRPELFLRAEEVAEISVPTLLLWGRQEKILPRSGLDFFLRYLPPHARFERPEGFGHAPHIDAAGELTACISRFARAEL